MNPQLVGGFDEGTGEALSNRVRSGTERSGVSTTASVESERCKKDPCFARVIAGAEATHLVRAVVKKDDRDYHIRLELHDDSGASVSVVEDTCEICGLEEAAEMIEAGATKLTSALTEGELPGTVEIRSRPPGATIIVDGEERGTTPVFLRLPAGSHRIELRKEGFATAARTVDLEAGMQTKSEMHLVPNARSPSRRAKIVGGTLLGAGLAMIGGGIALVAIDGREYSKRCDGADVDADGDCRLVYRLKWPGAALAASGAALAGVGITVLLIDRKRSLGTVRAGVTPNGLSLRGSF